MHEDEGQVVGGVLLPKSETHLREMMLSKKSGRVVDGLATYQYHKLEAAVALCRQRRAAVDIGAHVGLWSMWLARDFARVHAFEPLGAHRKLFERNVARWSNVTLHPCALGETEGEVQIRRPLETTGNAHVLNFTGRHPGTRHVEHPDRADIHEHVPMRTLDSFNLQEVDLIKIDVEGFERAVVQGAEETIRRCRPVICVEQKKNESAYGDAADAASHLLRSWGMTVARNIAGDHLMVWGQ